ncbi:MerC family mercury resistance protein [Halomonas sp. 328]|uniref:MerC family mercury resistance protein n=1 Tax=Halomonas sp. 328 TaxID=2776704 RepID=UPI0018A755C8|nr:MerC family mercury resistance protein [Halomonas sp. 328]MBF8223100.1 methyltransferase domain-containing protein [Halomonas sp. 328]
MVAILGYSRRQILGAVQQMYAEVARRPEAGFHFPVGREACEALGYPPAWLDRLPEGALASFAGVGCPFRGEGIRPGDRVLDIGAGAGVDSLIAGERVGPEGRVIALDLTAAMTQKLQRTIRERELSRVSVIRGSAEQLPLANASIDCITSNGALNLVPDKRRAVREMFRVLRPGGHLQLADVVIRRPVSVDCHEDPRLWVECVVGASVDEELVALFREAGFEAIESLGEHDYFALSPSDQTREVAQGFGARSQEWRMRRAETPPGPWQRAWRRLDPRRLWRRLRGHGLVGVLALGLALLSCYGTLALVALLPLLGLHLSLNEGLWAGAIGVFVLLTLGVVVASGIHRRQAAPALLGLGGALLVGHALFVDYQAWRELVGFLLLGGAVLWDLRRRRRQESALLAPSRGGE